MGCRLLDVRLNIFFKRPETMLLYLCVSSSGYMLPWLQMFTKREHWLVHECTYQNNHKETLDFTLCIVVFPLSLCFARSHWHYTRSTDENAARSCACSHSWNTLCTHHVNKKHWSSAYRECLASIDASRMLTLWPKWFTFQFVGITVWVGALG